MSFQFDLIPEGEVQMRQVFIGDPAMTGRISILAEITSSDDDLDLTVTVPGGSPEQLREVFEWLAEVFSSVEVNVSHEEEDTA